MSKEEQVKLKAVCLFVRDGKILVSRGCDKVTGANFYRALGGGINFFENSK